VDSAAAGAWLSASYDQHPLCVAALPPLAVKAPMACARRHRQVPAHQAYPAGAAAVDHILDRPHRAGSLGPRRHHSALLCRPGLCRGEPPGMEPLAKPDLHCLCVPPSCLFSTPATCSIPQAAYLAPRCCDHTLPQFLAVIKSALLVKMKECAHNTAFPIHRA
jgi:hypothetical protein